MSFQFSVAARNAWLDAIETAIGASAILKIRTGAVPATCATADAGTVLATMALPSDWMAGLGWGQGAGWDVAGHRCRCDRHSGAFQDLRLGWCDLSHAGDRLAKCCRWWHR